MASDQRVTTCPWPTEGESLHWDCWLSDKSEGEDEPEDDDEG